MGRTRHLAAGGARAVSFGPLEEDSQVILAERLSGSSSSHQLDHISKIHSCAQQSLLTMLTLLDLFSEIADSSSVLYRHVAQAVDFAFVSPSHFLSKFKF